MMFDVRNALKKLTVKENEKIARLKARLVALNLEHTQITADMERG